MSWRGSETAVEDLLQFAEPADLQNIAADRTNYGLYLADHGNI